MIRNILYDPKGMAFYEIPKQLYSPPQSPVLNPMEHILDERDRRIQLHAVASKKTIKNSKTTVSRYDKIFVFVGTKKNISSFRS